MNLMKWQVQSKKKDGFFTSSFHTTEAEAKDVARREAENGNPVSYCGPNVSKIEPKQKVRRR